MIRSLIATTLAAVLLSNTALAQEVTARVHVLKGRAVVRDEATAQTLLRSQDFSSSRPLQLEVGAGSQVEVHWSGLASLQVWGPTSLQWSPRSDSSLSWTFTDLAWADLEVRRGEHQLDLPGDWRTSVTGGALHLRGLPSGPVELRHHAGQPLTLEWRGDAAHLRPPVAVYAGSSLRLDIPPQADGSVRAWAPAAPPVAEGAPMTAPPAVEVRVDLHGGERTREPLTASRQPEFVASEDLRVTTRTDRHPREAQPETGSEASPATPPGSLNAAPQSDAPRATALPPLHEVAPTAPAAEQLGDPWRGVRGPHLTKAGPLWIQRSPGLEVRVTAAGSWKVLLDSSAPASVWCFGPEEDVRLSPGGVVTFSSTGALRLKFGQVDVRQAPSWRQPPTVD